MTPRELQVRQTSSTTRTQRSHVRKEQRDLQQDHFANLANDLVKINQFKVITYFMFICLFVCLFRNKYIFNVCRRISHDGSLLQSLG